MENTKFRHNDVLGEQAGEGGFLRKSVSDGTTDGNLKRGTDSHCLTISVVRSNGRMTEDNIVQKIKRWELMSKRTIARPKTRWKDDVLEDIKSINVSNWKKVAQNRESWKKVVEQARTLCGL